MTEEHTERRDEELELDPETVKDLEVEEGTAEDVPGGRIPPSAGCGGGPATARC